MAECRVSRSHRRRPVPISVDRLGGPAGASNRPALTALVNHQPDTMRTPNWRPTATAAAPMASTASADGARPRPRQLGLHGQRQREGGERATHRLGPRPHPANPTRTVDTGRPNRSAIPRWPSPAALFTSAAPITSTASARRTNASTGISTGAYLDLTIMTVNSVIAMVRYSSAARLRACAPRVIGSCARGG